MDDYLDLIWIIFFIVCSTHSERHTNQKSIGAPGDKKQDHLRKHTCLKSLGGGTVRVGCIRGPEGVGLGFLGCARGACAGHWAEWACRGAWGSPRWVSAGCRVWGVVRDVLLFQRVGEARVAGRGGARDVRRVGVSGWAARGKGHGRGSRAGVCCVGVCVRSQRRVSVVSCRPGGLEEKV